MGTSSSSSGPGSNVPLDPAWLNNILPDLLFGDLPSILQGTPAVEPPNREEIAAPQRFNGARRNLNKFAKTGSTENLRRALGHYSKNGMGGANRLASRMKVPSVVGVGMYRLLQEMGNPTDPNTKKWIDNIVNNNLSAYEIADQICHKIIQNGGTVDEESARNSINTAISDLIQKDPNVDLLKLSNEDIWYVIECFIGEEVSNRVILDIGQYLETSDISPKDRVERYSEMSDYIKAEVASNIEDVRNKYSNPTPKQIFQILHDSIKNTFEVFEGDL